MNTITLPNLAEMTAAPAVRMAAVPVLPETAPFSAEQRAWLNGFFAGLYGSQAAAPTQDAAVPMSSAPAGTTATEAAPAEEVEEDFPWHDPAMSMDERLKLAEGKKPERVLMAAMAQLDCGACGYLCQTYAEAIASGAEKDLTRCAPGGRDTSRMLKQIHASAPQKIVPVSEVTSKKAPAPAQDKEQEKAGWSRNNPFPSRLVCSNRLNGVSSAKDTRLVVLDLKGSNITYKPGDALGVFPKNCHDQVQEILEAMNLSGAEDVPGWDGLPGSLREALIRDYAIARPTPDLLDLLSRSATDESESEALKKMRDDETGLDPLQVLDLLRRFPSARPNPGDFVATLSPLAARLYSIASSIAAHPNQVHLTVGAVRYTNSEGRDCKGVASTYLADRVRPGQKVRVFVHPSHKFGLPSGERPVIMVGPGTGIAPFRAFLQERAAVGAKGKNWLFFGDQKGDCDFLFREELELYKASGLLTRLDTAFSRDQTEKVYVQDRMRENGAGLWAWLKEGGSFYVCGDAKRMALDVDKALRQVITQHAGLPTAGTDAFVSDLVRSGRYQRDVY